MIMTLLRITEIEIEIIIIITDDDCYENVFR